MEPVFTYGVGPTPARLMIVGEAWGEKEEREGRPFVGVSGEELDRYLSSIRMARDEVYITNLVNERPPGNSDPTAAMIAAHEARLREEIALVRPKYVVTLGRYSTLWFLPHLDPKKLMEREWGLGHPATIDGHTMCVVPIYHPAYGLYKPEDQILIQEGFEGRMGLTWGLARIMRGELPATPPEDQYPDPVYEELTEPSEVYRVLGTAGVIALDTEGSPAHPYCVTVSVEPGTGYLIAASNKPCIEALIEWLDATGPVVVCHYLMHDMEVCDALGIDLRRYKLADTMLLDYELGPFMSQSLKVSAYRLLGVRMQEYEELTAEADRALAVQYLETVLSEAQCPDCRGKGLRVWMVPATTIPAHTKTVQTKRGPAQRNMKAKLVPAHYDYGTCESCEGDGTTWPKPRALSLWENGQLTSWQPTSIGKRVRKILADLKARPSEVDPRDRWENVDPPEAVEPVIKKLGYMPTATLHMVDRDAVVRYACADADVTLRKYLLLDPLIDEWQLRDTYDTDLAIIPTLLEMQRGGVTVDRDYFAALSAEWKREMRKVRAQIQRVVGYYVNPASSKQVANLLFARLKLPPVKLTKSKLGESTDDKVLEQLAASTQHPVIPLLQRHRELHKLDGTYAEPLSEVDSEDGRVRMEIKYTRTDTGRLSSSKPKRGRDKHNWIQGQNIPTRGEEGKKIRKGIVARPGYLLGSWDLSQIEWRVMAHLSQDPNLLRVFREGHDLHRMTAALIWKIAIETVTKQQRDSAKNIGFGMGYKITWRGLQQQFAVRGIQLTEQEAQAFIDAFMAAYGGVPRFWERVFAEARRNGFIRSADGRIRWATAARCRASWVREAAERELGNHPVQGFAAWILKRILIRVGQRIVPAMRKAGFDVRVWLTVHDSIEMEAPESCIELLDALMCGAMRDTVRLSVPVLGEGQWGKSWDECKAA